MLPGARPVFAVRSPRRFEPKPRTRLEHEQLSDSATTPPKHLPLTSFVEHAQLPEDLLRALWGKQS